MSNGRASDYVLIANDAQLLIPGIAFSVDSITIPPRTNLSSIVY